MSLRASTQPEITLNTSWHSAEASALFILDLLIVRSRARLDEWQIDISKLDVFDDKRRHQKTLFGLYHGQTFCRVAIQRHIQVIQFGKA